MFKNVKDKVTKPHAGEREESGEQRFNILPHPAVCTWITSRRSLLNSEMMTFIRRLMILGIFNVILPSQEQD